MSLENLEKLPELVFEYSPESELEQLQYVLRPEKRKFYLEKGYEKRVVLPDGVRLDDGKIYSRNELLAFAEKELGGEKSEKIKQDISEVWPEAIQTLKSLFTELGYEMPESYHIRLTKYGPGGQFNPPNGMTVSFSQERNYSIEFTIIHEAIHDVIDPLIRKHGFADSNGHWVKEHMVDRLMAKVVPDSHIQETQLGAEKIEMIDKIFDQNYPNVEKILEEINKQIYDKQN